MNVKHQLVIYCKSYDGDVFRAKRLLQSINLHNKDNIPIYLSTPAKDQELFKKLLSDIAPYNWVSDESIILANPNNPAKILEKTPPNLSQQVIKSEFWRLGLCNNYLAIDSDSMFIKDFYISDFIADDGNPYTIFQQSKKFFQDAINANKLTIYENFQKESHRAKKYFGRETGLDYDFGPSPYIWSEIVWSTLDEKYLKPNNKTLWDLLNECPPENRWYGEALLATKCITLHPIENLFKVYHYEWEYKKALRENETLSSLQHTYLGVISQSNWDKNAYMEYKRKSFPSRSWRKIKRFFSE